MRKSRDDSRIVGANGQKADWKTVPMQRATAVEGSNPTIKRGCWDACGFRPVERVGYIQGIGMTMAGDENTAMCDQRALFWSFFTIKTLRTRRAYSAFFQGERCSKKCLFRPVSPEAGRKGFASVRRVGAKNASCSVFIEKNDQRPDAFSRKERIAATDVVGMLLAKRKKARVEERKTPSVGRGSSRWAFCDQLRF